MTHEYGAHVEKVRNVNQAYQRLKYLVTHRPELWRTVGPRGMQTIEWTGTFITEYTRPRERVLFDPTRDANPFFHFFESLWILGGRDDVAYLAQFNSKMSDFSDNGVNFHAPYGARLRVDCSGDQLTRVIRLLQEQPDTRRAVLQIWREEKDLYTDSKDIPCNDLVFLKQRDGKLNMTILCRSNDAIWGAYGANAVQFSVLQEFIASAIGAEVGSLVQVSDSFHVYVDRPDYAKVCGFSEASSKYDYYSENLVKPYQIIPKAPDIPYQLWLHQLDLFLREKLLDHRGDIDEFFLQVAMPLLQTWRIYKGQEQMSRPDIPKNERIYMAMNMLIHCQAEDWKVACGEWLNRRREGEQGK